MLCVCVEDNEAARRYEPPIFLGLQQRAPSSPLHFPRFTQESKCFPGTDEITGRYRTRLVCNFLITIISLSFARCDLMSFAPFFAFSAVSPNVMTSRGRIQPRNMRDSHTCRWKEEMLYRSPSLSLGGRAASTRQPFPRWRRRLRRLR